MGWKNVKVFHDGMPAWKKAGMPVEVSVKHIKALLDKDMPFVLIDLRDPKEATKEHLPQAVNIPINELPKYKDKFPERRKAPIYLYGLPEKDLIKAFNIVRNWGYENTGFIRDAIENWKKIGAKTESGALKKEIVYIPKPVPGSFNIEEFKKLVFSDSLPDNYFIIDVREPDEVQAGTFKFAKNIPLGEIANRLNEIPKDKTIILFCATGVRSEMAYNILKDKGFKAYFINANITFEDGKVNIEPKD
ncbi:MAG: rhodanese-like domain-containing protein [Caldimicrobium sp.]